jgi:hypothetical protein
MADALVTTFTIYLEDGEEYTDWTGEAGATCAGTFRVARLEFEIDGGPGVLGGRWRIWAVRVLGKSGRVSAPQVAYPPDDVAYRAKARLGDALRANGVEVTGL